MLTTPIGTKNSIVNNGMLGIDLGGVGVTANDPGDGDSGPTSATHSAARMILLRGTRKIG